MQGNNQIPTGGSVVVIYGSAHGLDLSTAKIFTESQFLPAGNPDFGSSLAAGDFNGDGLGDLAIGAEGADVGGGVAILYGTSTGLTLTKKQFFTQDSAGVPGTGESFDGFGTSLAAADFNGDGKADLAVGVPFESIGDIDFAGDVVVLLGSKTGLTGTGSTSWSQSTSGVPGTAEQDDEFGLTLAAGDLTGDGKADLVIGDQHEAVGAADDGGSVTVLHGASGGLTATGAQAWSEATSGVPGTEQSGGEFGEWVTVGDLNGDGHADIAIGTNNAVGSVVQGGSVVMLRGSSSGMSTTGAQYWDQNTAGISGSAETEDFFGMYVQAVNIVSTKYSGLVIGVPGEDTATFTDNGAIEVMRGGSSGLTATSSQFFDSQGLVGGAEDNEQMGTGPFE
ncbi:MAG TPA: FG-GAP-like repeat-containing protein [Micromonosporaceae bacterium]